MKNIILLIISLLLFSCSTNRYLNSMVSTKPKIATELSLDYQRRLFFVDLKINGRNAKFLVDTGASLSLVNIENSRYYEFTYKKNYKQVSGLGGSRDRYDIKNISLTDKDGNILYINFEGANINHVVNNMNKDGINIVGVIGSDFLKNSNAIINYADNSIKLYSNVIIDQ